jgi:hypothetical protein
MTQVAGQLRTRAAEKARYELLDGSLSGMVRT